MSVTHTRKNIFIFREVSRIYLLPETLDGLPNVILFIEKTLSRSSF
jgi:hypothetical protein